LEPAGVGIVLDTSVIIAAERRGHSVSEILEQIKKIHGEAEIAISVMSIAELVHGAYRAQTQVQHRRRLDFIGRLSSDVPVHPLTIDIARLVGRIEGEQASAGIQISLEDLVIGATALHLGYEVATLNLRDFQRIPGLSVIRI
jgi:predicted nucleic acid-binding protein